MDRVIEKLSDWLEYRQMRGYYCFTKEEVSKALPTYSKENLSISLYRYVSKSKIVNIWQNFYIIMPIEYALKAIIPPTFYIDQLMSFLNKKYYVALLNAASFYGSAHQRPQTFSVMVELPSLRSQSKNGESLLFYSKKVIPSKYLKQIKTKSGYINVSSPELTVIDLIEKEKYIGGLNRACAIINELLDIIDIENLEEDFFQLAPMPVFQRLGYILESIIDRQDLADELYNKVQGHTIRKVPLKTGKPINNYEVDKKWKVIINQEIEIDE